MTTHIQCWIITQMHIICNQYKSLITLYYSRPSLIQTSLIRTLANLDYRASGHVMYHYVLHVCSHSLIDVDIAASSAL